MIQNNHKYPANKISKCYIKVESLSGGSDPSIALGRDLSMSFGPVKTIVGT